MNPPDLLLDDGRSARQRRSAAPRFGRVSFLAIGSIVIISAGLFVAVAWPTLWWDLTPQPMNGHGRGSKRWPGTAAGPARVTTTTTVQIGTSDFPAYGTAAIAEIRTQAIEKPLAEVRQPVAREDRRLLAGSKRTARGVMVTEIGLSHSVPTLPLPPPHIGQYAAVSWIDDARSFVVLSTKGELRQITYPGLIQSRFVDLGHACRHLLPSGAGLVVTLPPLQELWVLDPLNMEVRRRIGISGLRRALTGPNLTVAIALATGPDRGVSLPILVDLTDGSQTGLSIRAGAPLISVSSGPDFRPATLAPNGRTLFAMAGSGQLVRYSLEGNLLTMDDASGPIARGAPGTIGISPDGRWVCLPSSDGHNGAEDGLFIYSTDDLTRPASKLRTGMGCYVVGWDAAGQRRFAQNTDQPLLVYDAAGVRQDFPSSLFPGEPHDVIQYLPHPDGRGLLVLTSEALFLVECTGD